MLFDLHTEELDGWAVVVVIGDLDLATVPRVRNEVVAAVAAGRARVVLDLRGVDLLDSAGLGLVVAALRRTRQHGGDLRVAATEDRVRSVFTLTGLDRVVVVADTPDAAVAVT